MFFLILYLAIYKLYSISFIIPRKLYKEEKSRCPSLYPSNALLLLNIKNN